MEKNYTEKIQALRKEITGDIIALMKKHGLDTLYASDIDDGSTPVIMSNPDIEDLTYTLDKDEILRFIFLLKYQPKRNMNFFHKRLAFNY